MIEATIEEELDFYSEGISDKLEELRKTKATWGTNRSLEEKLEVHKFLSHLLDSYDPDRKDYSNYFEAAEDLAKAIITLTYSEIVNNSGKYEPEVWENEGNTLGKVRSKPTCNFAYDMATEKGRFYRNIAKKKLQTYLDEAERLIRLSEKLVL